MNHRPIYLLALALVACGGEDSTPDAARYADSAELADATNSVVNDAGVDAVDIIRPDAGQPDDATLPSDVIEPDAEPNPQADEFDELVAQYGILTTVAGTGRFREGGENGWDDSAEGGPAIEAELSRPHMAQADDHGNIYIADKDAHAIRVIRPDGTIHTLAGVNEPGDDGDAPGPATERHLAAPNGMWVRGDGVFYTLGLGSGKIRRVGADGIMTTMLTDPRGFGTGRGIWVRPDEGLIYYSGGTALRMWTPEDGIGTLVAGFEGMGNIFVEESGDIIVTDRQAHRVWRVSPEGEKTLFAGNGNKNGGGDGARAVATGLDNVRGVWGHPMGGHLLATHKGGQIWYVDTAGIIHLFLDGDTDHTHAGDGEHFRTPGPKISEPRAVSVDPEGRIIVTENDYGYIRIIERAQ